MSDTVLIQHINYESIIMNAGANKKYIDEDQRSNKKKIGGEECLN